MKRKVPISSAERVESKVRLGICGLLNIDICAGTALGG
jgi:hypothetical protein